MKLERVPIDGKEYFVISEAEMAKERMEKRNTGSAEEKADSPISRFNQSVSGGAKKLLSDTLWKWLTPFLRTSQCRTGQSSILFVLS